MADVRRMRDEYTGLLRRRSSQRGVERRAVRRRSTRALTALQIFGMCNWTWTWYRPEGAWSAEDIAETFTRVIFNGLGNGTTIELSADVPDVVRATIAEHAEAPVATG